MVTSMDYIALDPIGVYWLGINGIVAVDDDAVPYPSAGEVALILEKPIGVSGAIG
ncbi:hypothetical protein H6F86_20915 [Phormidium sp. FACHB-592]|uniref:Uncharacterized protein n=1 Tax=Stenomitos frigidus AS-A4 TaxID=2933935 RepID=A0ABV0KEM6_9CYAN|nr:hypothetical protein [Phormidium sp. FACHB-592]MBD2076296.1 hypothetical protein [Phormidium sp. FACHB-592]